MCVLCCEGSGVSCDSIDAVDAREVGWGEAWGEGTRPARRRGTSKSVSNRMRTPQVAHPLNHEVDLVSHRCRTRRRDVAFALGAFACRHTRIDMTVSRWRPQRLRGDAKTDARTTPTAECVDPHTMRVVDVTAGDPSSPPGPTPLVHSLPSYLVRVCEVGGGSSCERRWPLMGRQSSTTYSR